MADEYESVNQETVAPDDHAAQEPRKQTPASENFRRLEEKARNLEKELERERQEKQWMMQNNRPAQPVQQGEPEFDWNSLETDDYVDGKKMSKAFGQINKKLNEKDQKIAYLESIVANKDFAEVVTDENVKKYIANDPDLVRAVQTASNPGATMYKLIAKNADYRDEVAKRSKPMTQEHKKIAENAEKPRTSPNTVRSEAVRTAARFSELSKQERAALWAETQNCSRRTR